MPSSKRRRGRNLIVALLLLGLAAWIVPSYFSAERYRRRLQAGLEQALHRPVQFGAVSFRLIPRPGFSIENAEVGGDPDFSPEPFARVDRIDCDLRWASLWRSHLDFAHLHLERPSFNVVVNPRGEWNLERLLRQSGVTAPAAAGNGASGAAEQLDLDVNDARINFQVGPNKKPFALTDVRARLQVNPARRRVQFQITASPVRSDLAIPTPGPVEVSGTWTPGGDLRGPIDARLRTRGSLLYDWIPIVTGKNPQLYGVMDSDVRLTGSLPDLSFEGDAHLTQLHRWAELPPSDSMPWTFRFRGRLVRGRERVEVENLEASFAGSHLHLAGTMDKLQSDPQLDLVVSLDRSRIEDVMAVARRLWPVKTSWKLQGKVEAMLAIRGSWKDRTYGGFLGARQVSLETPSGSFPISDIAVRINRHGAHLAPVQVSLAPHVSFTAQGGINRARTGFRYQLLLAARSVPLHDAVSFGRGLNIRGFQGLDASGSATAALRLSGPAWPLTRPVLIARVEMQAARLLIPGLTEPLNLPHARIQINGDRITADPVVAVLGTSVFNARLAHHGARTRPWVFDVHANSLRLEEGAQWFTALGVRRPLPLLERLPGLASFAARRHAASEIFGSLNAQGRFATPALSYRGVMLKDFQGTFEVAGRTIRMKTARFRAGGGTGTAEGAADFTSSSPVVTAKVSLVDVALQALTAHFPGSGLSLHGLVDATGKFQTRGLGRDELAGNLAGQMELRVRNIAFGDFDPLGALVQHAHLGRLDPPRGPVTAPAAALNLKILDRRFVLQSMALDLSGARLQLDGTCAWTGAANLMVRADLRHLHRRWIERQDNLPSGAHPVTLRLSGPIDHLVVNVPEGDEGTGNRPEEDRIR